jgi:hypothetical protein
MVTFSMQEVTGHYPLWKQMLRVPAEDGMPGYTLVDLPKVLTFRDP